LDFEMEMGVHQGVSMKYGLCSPTLFAVLIMTLHVQAQSPAILPQPNLTPETAKFFNRWVEAPDFKGGSIRLSRDVELTDRKQQYLQKEFSSDDGRTLCRIRRKTPDQSPKATLTPRKTWQISRVVGPEGIAADKKREAIRDSAKLKDYIDGINKRCKDLGQLQNNCIQMSTLNPVIQRSHDVLELIEDQSGAMSYKPVDFGKKELDYLNAALEPFILSLVDSDKNEVRVLCIRRPAHERLRLDEAPQLTVAAYHSLLTTNGFIFEKDGQALKPYVTNGDVKVQRAASARSAP
jgi:hypothetical protein